MLPSERDEPCHLEVERVIASTDKAILCLFDTGDKEWIPLSMIDTDCKISEKGDSGELVIPMWLAKEKGLV